MKGAGSPPRILEWSRATIQYKTYDYTRSKNILGMISTMNGVITFISRLLCVAECRTRCHPDDPPSMVSSELGLFKIRKIMIRKGYHGVYSRLKFEIILRSWLYSFQDVNARINVIRRLRG